MRAIAYSPLRKAKNKTYEIIKGVYTLIMSTTVKKMPQEPVRKIMWGNLLFFISTTFFGVFGAAFYLIHFGLSLSEILLFVFYVFATIFSITVGYHRLFSHVSFKAETIIRFLTLFFGAASFEQSALIWCSQHRKHHRYVDTDLDPYNIKKGFFYAHFGWMAFWQHADEFDNVLDLQKSRMIMSQHRHYALWAVASGIILPVIIGALMGGLVGAVGAFLIAFCARVTVVYHITWCINSFAHTFGKATYDIDSTAKDNWFAALLTNGEGYHNYHHRFPGDYRNGVRWYDWDPSKWIINLLWRMGLARDLIRVSKFRIYAARINAEKQRLERLAVKKSSEPERVYVQDLIHAQYERLRQTLHDWEVSTQEYRDVIQGKIERQSEAGRLAALKYFESRRLFRQYFAQFKLAYQKI